MPDPKPKIVKVEGLGTISFPGDMPDEHISQQIMSHLKKQKTSPITTEESEHARQLKPAQPLSTAIPKLPEWANKPILSGLTFDAQIERAEKGGHQKDADWLRKQKALQDKAYEKNKEKYPIATGVTTGVGEFADSMTSPANLALIVGSPQSKLLSALFSIQALRGSYQNAQQAQEAYEKGNNAEAAKYATEAGLGIGVAYGAGKHAVKDIPVPYPVKSFIANEEGSIGPQEKASNTEAENKTFKMLTDGKAGGYTLDHLLKNHPDVTIISETTESIDPSTLKRIQGWTRESKLNDWKDSNVNVKDMPPVEVVRTEHGNYLYDGTHRTEFATRQGEKVPAKVYAIKTVGNKGSFDPKSGSLTDPRAPKLPDVKAKAAELKPTTAYQTVDQSKPFYLKSENLINEKMKGPMPAEDVHKMLLSNGVKPEEMKWTGLDELLQGKGKQKVTPQEIQEHLAGNNLQVQEVTKGAALGAKNPNELSVEEYGKPYDQLDAYQQRYIDTITEAHDKASPHATKYGSYVLPGGEPGSYREIVLTLPENRGNAARDARIAELVTERRKGIDNLQRLKSQLEESGYGPGTDSIVNEIRAQSAQIAKAEKDAADLRRDNHDSSFRSNHWPDEVNPASHVRFDDRTGPNGEKILFIEEAQDDWAQKGRKEGYKSNRVPTKATRHDGYWEVHDQDGNFITNIQDWQHPEITNEEQVLKEAQNRLENNPERIRNDGKVPDRPFKKTDEWTALVMKRMVKYAVDHGYDAVAWAQGSVHFDRWGSQRFDWKKNGDHWEVAGTEQHGGNAGGVNIEEEAERQGYLQKGAAKVKTEADLRKIVKQVMSRESNDAQIDTQTKKIWTRMQNEDSGTSMPRKEGFEAYYDQMVPQAANKLGKQWGAKVGETKIEVPASWKEQHNEYVGPDRSLEDVEKLHQLANRSGRDIHRSPFTENEHMFAVNRVSVARAAEAVLSKMDSVPGGVPFKEAMTEEGTPELAEYFGGKLEVRGPKPKKTPVPYLPITPQMRAGVKSIPYSLFTIPLAAGALTLAQVKAEADKLRKGETQ